MVANNNEQSQNEVMMNMEVFGMVEKKVFDLSFWQVIAKFEWVNGEYPFDDYFSVDRKDISFIRRIAKIERRLEWMLGVVKNARHRYRKCIMDEPNKSVINEWDKACIANGIKAEEYETSHDFDDDGY